MSSEPTTRHSHVLPELRFSLNLLYVGRLLLGMQPQTAPGTDDPLDVIDEQIELITDELVSTELLHQASILAGDVGPAEGQ